MKRSPTHFEVETFPVIISSNYRWTESWLIQTSGFLSASWSVATVLSYSIVWKVRTWLPSFSSSSALAVKNPWVVWLQSCFWEVVPPITPGHRADLWVSAAGRGISPDVFVHTACVPGLVSYFLAMILILAHCLLYGHNYAYLVLAHDISPVLFNLTLGLYLQSPAQICAVHMLALLQPCKFITVTFKEFLGSLFFDTVSILVLKLEFSLFLQFPS